METKIPTLAKADKAKGQASKPAQQAITPPDGWELDSQFGFMAFDAMPAGRLVRLADVLHWLEKTHSLPRVVALEEMCKAMPPDVVSWLYWVQPTDYAKPVPVDWMWGGRTAAQIEETRKADIAKLIRAASQRELENDRNGRFGATWHFESTGKQITMTPPVPTEPGLPALLKILGKYWKQSRRTRLSTCDILDDPTMTNLVNLAIRLDKAAALWGYGCSKTDQAIDAVAGPVEWTGQMLLAQQTALKLSGVKAYTETLSEMSGLAVREVTRRIKASRDPKPATVWNVTSLVNGKKSKKTSKA